jgi:hypothetical protein
MNIPWMEPRDLRVDQLGSNDCAGLPQPGISGLDHDGAGLLCFGGRVMRIKPAMLLYHVKGMVTISGNEQVSECQY